MSDENKLGIGKCIDASFKRKRDKIRAERWFLQVPIELVKQSNFKDGDRLLVQLIGMDKLVITKFKLVAPE